MLDLAHLDCCPLSQQSHGAAQMTHVDTGMARRSYGVAVGTGSQRGEEERWRKDTQADSHLGVT